MEVQLWFNFFTSTRSPSTHVGSGIFSCLDDAPYASIDGWILGCEKIEAPRRVFLSWASIRRASTFLDLSQRYSKKYGKIQGQAQVLNVTLMWQLSVKILQLRMKFRVRVRQQAPVWASCQTGKFSETRGCDLSNKDSVIRFGVADFFILDLPKSERFFFLKKVRY